MLLNNKYEYNPKTDLLGKGGFGRVYKGRNILLDKEVALKMVTIQGTVAEYSLVEEVKRAFELIHPNIIRYYDVFVLKDTTYTGEETETQVGVMEYLPYGDIGKQDWLALTPVQQKDILIQILGGLGYLHQNKIIHRDIKPSNILIKKEGERIIPKITDFGISKSQDAASVSVSRVIGSIPYMAPEQFESNGRASFNTDLWSLGILVYRLFTGNLPFGDETTSSEGVIMKNIMEMPVPLQIKQIPMPFRSLVELCLVKDRTKRVDNTSILVDVLQNYQCEMQTSQNKFKPAAKDTIPETSSELSAKETTKVYTPDGVSQKPRKSTLSAIKTVQTISSDKQAKQAKPAKPVVALKPKVKPRRKIILISLISVASLLLMIVIWKNRMSGKSESAYFDKEYSEIKHTVGEGLQIKSTEESSLIQYEPRKQNRAETEDNGKPVSFESKVQTYPDDHIMLEETNVTEEQYKDKLEAQLERERKEEEQKQKEKQERLAAELKEEKQLRDKQAQLEAQRQEEERRRFLASAGTFTDNRDGKTYNWVRIGKQVWMAENLVYRPTSGNYRAYDNDQSNVLKYGYLYDWYTARNVCPPGWSLPNDADWAELVEFVGGVESGGEKLKARNGWIRVGNGLDKFGFVALPGGRFNLNGLFEGAGVHGNWWSSSEVTNELAWNRYMYFGLRNIYRVSHNKNVGQSVRCIRKE